MGKARHYRRGNAKRWNAGMTMIEMIVALGLGAVSLYALATVMNTMDKVGINSRTLTARNAVVGNIRRYSANPLAMNITMNVTYNKNTSQLNDCITGGNHAGGCSDGTYGAYALYDRNSVEIAGPNAGPSPSPGAANPVIVYNIDGAPSTAGCSSSTAGCICPTAGLLCPILAETYFLARCPSSGCNWSVAQPSATPTVPGGVTSNVTIETHYFVWQAPDSYAGVTKGNTMMQTVKDPPVPLNAQEVNRVCSAAAPFKGGTAKCTLPATADGVDATGTCPTAGTCAYTCVEGVFKQVSSSDGDTCS